MGKDFCGRQQRMRYIRYTIYFRVAATHQFLERRVVIKLRVEDLDEG
jgi:hypothetical protein